MYIHSLERVGSETKIAECNETRKVIERRPIWREDVIIKGKKVSFKVDTGSDVTVIPKKLLDIIPPGWRLKNSTIMLRAFGGNIIKPLGMCELYCVCNGKKSRIEIEIVDFDTVPLLGLVACIAFGLVDVEKVSEYRNKSFFMNNATELEIDKDFVEKNYSDLFKGLGKFETPYKILLKENSIPVAHAARRVPWLY